MQYLYFIFGMFHILKSKWHIVECELEIIIHSPEVVGGVYMLLIVTLK